LRKFAEQKLRLKPINSRASALDLYGCLSSADACVVECAHSPSLVVLSARAKRFSCERLDKTHIQVLANEHRRLTCFGQFSLFF